MKFLLKCLFKILFKMKVLGLEKFNFEGPTIIMPNHISYIDPFLLYAFLPKKVSFVVDTAIAKKFRLFFRFINHITVDQLNPYSLKKLIKLIKQERTIVIFPEGRLTATGNLMKIYTGIGLIAAKSNAKIYPVNLMGPEHSKLCSARLSKLMNSRWFPQMSIYIDTPFKIELSKEKSFRKQKFEISNKILISMQNTMFKAKQELCESQNLFNKLLESSDIHGSNKKLSEDLSSSMTYKKTILTSYILGDKFIEILGEENAVATVLPTANAHLATLFGLCYAGKRTAMINFTAGYVNNLECSQAAGIKTIITSKVFVEKAKLTQLIEKLASNFKIIYLEDVKSTITGLDKIKGLVKYMRKHKATNDQNNYVILFTSGSESKPKGVLLSHKNIISNINQISSAIDLTHSDKIMNSLPMFHSMGLTTGTLLPVFKGVEVFLYPSPLHYKIIPELIYDKSATVIIGTPSFLMGYAKNAHHYDFNSLRYVIAGGEKLKEDVRQIWSNKFGIRIFEGYGTTETAPVLSINTPLFNRIGSVGIFLPGIEWKLESVDGIEDAGNLLVKGSNVMEGYLLYDKGFVPAAEWYNCGDIINVDKDGFITIKARLKRFAKISGEMVSLDALESLAEKVFVGESHAAVSVLDSKKGEKIVMFTTSTELNKKALREYITQNGYSTLIIPTNIVLLDKLPILGNGKVDYVKLMELSKEGKANL